MKTDSMTGMKIIAINQTPTPMTFITLARHYGVNIRAGHSLGGVVQTKEVVFTRIKKQLANSEMTMSQYDEMIAVLKEMNL